MQIPKGFSQKLKENRLKETIQLYGRDDFIGGIAVEIVSSSLYEQQIPNIIYEHLEDMKQHQSIDAINKSYQNIHLNLNQICVLLNKHNTPFQSA